MASDAATVESSSRKREREPGLCCVFVVESSCTTTVDSFGDTSHIDSSAHGEDDAESVIKEALEDDMGGFDSMAYISRASAVAARDKSFERVIADARHEVRTMLSAEFSRRPLTESEYDELKRKEVIVERVETSAAAGSQQSAPPPVVDKFDERTFTIVWGPDPAHHAERIRRYGDCLGACERLITEVSVWLRRFDVESRESLKPSKAAAVG